MDQEQLKLLAHLKVTSRKVGLDLDLPRLIADRVYAIERLDVFATSDNEDLVLTALTVKDKLGLMPVQASPTPESPEPKAGDKVVKKDPEKYKFGPRG
jgi:hypothetical protein